MPPPRCSSALAVHPLPLLSSLCVHIMRAVCLLRAARQAVLAAEPLGCGLAGEACGSSSSSAAVAPLRQLSSLLHLAAPPQQQPHQRQQRAGLAARRREDDDEDELPEGLRHASKLSPAERKHLAERRLWQQKNEDLELEEELAAGMAAAEERKEVIQGLLRGMTGQDAASNFVSRWVSAPRRATGSRRCRGTQLAASFDRM